MDDIMEDERTYTFDELSDHAKECALDKHRQVNVDDFDWWDAVYDDAQTIAGMLGFGDIDIAFSGFWSQGDGASFTGEWSPRPYDLDAVKEYAPNDTELHEIAALFVTLSTSHKRYNRYNIDAKVERICSHYSHENTVRASMDFRFPDEFDDWNEFQQMVFTAANPEPGQDYEDDLTDAVRRFCRWIYRQLEAEYRGLTSDEVIAEYLSGSHHQFTEEGDDA